MKKWTKKNRKVGGGREPGGVRLNLNIWKIANKLVNAKYVGGILFGRKIKSSLPEV